MKTCNTCNSEKSLGNFSIKKNGRHSNKCNSCKKEYRLKYYENNKEQMEIVNKKWRENNKDKIKSYHKEYYKNNKEIILKKKSRYVKKRRSEDPLFRLKGNIKALIRKALNKNNFTKSSRTFDILGCSYAEFITYLNDNPYGFKYEDGLYDLDHIVPISSAKTEEEILKLSHYSNFQLLPSEYNQNIKIDNNWNKSHFEEWLKTFE